MEKVTNTAKTMEETIKRKIAPFSDVPILFVSALEKQRIFKAVETALEIFENKQRKISTSKLNEVLEQAVAEVQPPAHRGHMITFKYITQLPTASPTFIIFSNFPEDVKEPYRNYLEKKLRLAFKFEGVPISLFFRKK
jgi:GTP-binding protein